MARIEAYVPEFSQGGRAAFLDVWGFGHAELQDVLIDVTHRHPMKVDSQPRAAKEPGHCCKQAAADKEQRYPARGGRRVTTACVEAWGRLSAEAEELLVHAAGVAARNDRRRGRNATSRLSTWRARLDAVTQRGVALALRSCYEGLPGRPPARSESERLSWTALSSRRV